MIFSQREVLSIDGTTLTIYVAARMPRDELEAMMFDEPEFGAAPESEEK